MNFYLLLTDDLYSIMLTTGDLYNTVLTQVICKTANNGRFIQLMSFLLMVKVKITV